MRTTRAGGMLAIVFAAVLLIRWSTRGGGHVGKLSREHVRYVPNRSPNRTRTYYGEENWDLPPSPPHSLPPLDSRGCFHAIQELGYKVVAQCSKPMNVRPARDQNEPQIIVDKCVFVPDNRCCSLADGVTFDVRTRALLMLRAQHLNKMRRERPDQIWFAESTETYQSNEGQRPLGKKEIMKSMDYAAYFGMSADFPLLPNLDYRNKLHRDLLAWPGRDVMLTTARPLPILLAGKTGGVMYMSSDCASSHGSDRDDFVKKFMTYLAVDSLGSCQNNKPWDKHNTRSDFRNASAELISRYRFRLVLPNTICEDYVVEKFSQTLLFGTIPIFLGAPNGKNFDPGLAAGLHPAAIYVTDFDGFDELVQHVQNVGKDRDAYLRYFEWVGKRATWPMHFDQIDQRRQGATSFLQYACERTLEGKRQPGAAVPTNCHSTWRKYFFEELGKNRSKWQKSIGDPVQLHCENLAS